MSNPKMETMVKFSDIYAAEDAKFGLIHKAIPNTKGLFCEGYSEVHLIFCLLLKILLLLFCSSLTISEFI